MLFIKKNPLIFFLVFSIPIVFLFSKATYANGIILAGESSVSLKNNLKKARGAEVSINITAEAQSVKEGKSIRINVTYVNLNSATEYCLIKVDTSIVPINGASVADYKIQNQNNTSSQDDYVIITALSDNEIDPNEAIKITFTPKISGGSCVLSSSTPAEVVIKITESTIARKKEEPEYIKQQTCDALEQESTLEGDDKSFFDSNCKQGSTRHFEPEETTAQTSAVLGAVGRQLGNIRHRLDQLRMTKGKRDIDVSDVALNVQGETISVGLLGGAAGDDDNTLLENSRWGFFAGGESAFGKEDRGNDAKIGGGDRNFDFNSKGLTFGVDYRFPQEKMIAGIAIGYKDFESDFTSQKGGITLKGYNINAYGTYFLSDKAYVDAILGFGKDSLDARRPINNDGTGGIGDKTTFAIGEPDATEFVFSVGGGYEFYKGEWSLTPYGRMDYIKGSIDAYQESTSHDSARTSTFQFNKQNIIALTSTLGIKTSRAYSTAKGVFVPYASAEWKHEFKGRSLISGSSIYLNKKFTEGDRSKFDKNYYNLGVGVSAQLPKGRSTYLSVESRQGDSAVEDNIINAGFRWEF